MRKLIILALLCAPAWAGGVLVGTPVSSGSANPVSVSYTVQAAGNIIVVCLKSTNSSTTTPSATGYSFSSVYSRYVTSDQSGQCYTTVAGSTGATTFTGTASPSSVIYIAVAEFTGLGSSATVDGTPVSANGTGTTWSSGSFSTSYTSTLLSWGCSTNSATTYTKDASWSLVVASSPLKCLMQYFPNQAAGSYTSTATTNSSQNWFITGFALKEASANHRRGIMVVQ